MAQLEDEESSAPSRSSRQTSWSHSFQRLMQQERLQSHGPDDELRYFYKVPPHMRHANKNEYDPMAFTFGPYNAEFGVPLSSFDRQKVWIAKALTDDDSFDAFWRRIQGRQDDIRKIYCELCANGRLVDDLQSDDLAKLLALDALTVVGVASKRITKLIRPPGLRPTICRDAMLLEQQLPLFILKDAIDIINSNTSHHGANHDSYKTSLEKVVSFYARKYSYPFQRRVENWKWQDPTDLKQSMLSHIYSCTFAIAPASGVLGLSTEPSTSPITNAPLLASSPHAVRTDLPPAAADEGSEPSQHAAEEGSEPSTSTSHQQSIAIAPVSGVLGSSTKPWTSPMTGEVEGSPGWATESRLPSASKLQRCGIHFKAGDGNFRGITIGEVEGSPGWATESRLPSASKLQRCGIHFKAGDGNFRGISFDERRRELTLPQIKVLDTTKAYLLNLAAHEALISVFEEQQCPVISYILLMGFLIDEEEDVNLLVKKKVINNQLASNKQLAEMWNTLTINLPIGVTEKDIHTSLIVLEASQNKLDKCWARFRDTYFEQKPWLLISFIAACVLLLLILIATVFTILQFRQGPPSLS